MVGPSYSLRRYPRGLHFRIFRNYPVVARGAILPNDKTYGLPLPSYGGYLCSPEVSTVSLIIYANRRR